MDWRLRLPVGLAAYLLVFMSVGACGTGGTEGEEFFEPEPPKLYLEPKDRSTAVDGSELKVVVSGRTSSRQLDDSTVEEIERRIRVRTWPGGAPLPTNVTLHREESEHRGARVEYDVRPEPPLEEGWHSLEVDLDGLDIDGETRRSDSETSPDESVSSVRFRTDAHPRLNAISLARKDPPGPERNPMGHKVVAHFSEPLQPPADSPKPWKRPDGEDFLSVEQSGTPNCSGYGPGSSPVKTLHTFCRELNLEATTTFRIHPGLESVAAPKSLGGQTAEFVVSEHKEGEYSYSYHNELVSRED